MLYDVQFGNTLCQTLMSWKQSWIFHFPCKSLFQAPFMRVLRLPPVAKYSPPCRDLVDIIFKVATWPFTLSMKAEKFMNDISASDHVVTVITAFSGHLWLRWQHMLHADHIESLTQILSQDISQCVQQQGGLYSPERCFAAKHPSLSQNAAKHPSIHII